MFKKILLRLLIALTITSAITIDVAKAAAIVTPVVQQIRNDPKTVGIIGDSITQYNFVGGLQLTGVWSSAIAGSAAGTGYVTGDTINLGNGLTISVTAVAGNVTGATFVNYGAIASAPSNPVAQVSTSGLGTGASFNITWTSFGSSFPPVGTGGGAWSLDYVESECPGGVGVLTYNGTTLTWTPNGLSAGAAVDATRTGKIYVPGPSALQGIWLNWFVNRGGYSATALSLDVQANGFQLWQYQAKGFLVSALAQSGQNLAMATNNAFMRGREEIFGLGGASSDDIASAAWQWRQLTAQVIIENTGTNDIAGSISPATIIANRKLVWDWATRSGKILIIMTIPPRGIPVPSATQLKQRAQVDQYAYYYAKTHARTYLANDSKFLEDPANGKFVLTRTGDGIHPSGIGGYWGAKPLGTVLASLATTNVYETQYGDLYHVTDNPYGNLLPTGQGIWAGTAGTIGTGCTGAAALGTGWSCSRTTGSNLTAALSQVARTDGVQGVWQQVQLSGATTTEAIQIVTNPTSITSLGAGTKLEALLEVNIPTQTTGLNNLDLWMAPNGGVQARVAHAYDTLGGDPAPGTLWLKIPQWTVPAGATGFQPIIRLGCVASCTATINLGRVFFRQVQP